MREKNRRKMSLPVEELAKVVGGGDPNGEARFYSLVQTKLGIQRSNIKPGNKLGDLGPDSVEIVDFICNIEDEFGIN